MVSDVHGKHLVVPVNLTVVEGSPTLLPCQNDESVTIVWHYLASPESGGKSVRYLYNGFTLDERYDGIYMVDQAVRGQHDLVINTTRRSHAGTYICAESASSTQFTSELVVLSKQRTTPQIFITLNTFSFVKT